MNARHRKLRARQNRRESLKARYGGTTDENETTPKPNKQTKPATKKKPAAKKTTTQGK